MKQIKLLALLGVSLPCLSQAAVNVISRNFTLGSLATTSNPIIFNGVPAPAGSGTVAVGIFGSTDAQIAAVGNSFGAWSDVIATFTQFGASAPTIGAGAGGTAGLFRITPGDNVAGTSFEGRNVYVVIGNNATLPTSTQYIVFKSNTTFLAEPTPSVNADLTDATPGQQPAGELLLGIYGAAQVYYATGPLAGQTLTSIMPGVPEGTTPFLGMLGFGCSFMRRRR